MWDVCLAGPRLYYPKTTDAQLAVLWIILVQPLLFGCIGIELDFRVIKGTLVPKTIIILAIGMPSLGVVVLLVLLLQRSITASMNDIICLRDGSICHCMFSRWLHLRQLCPACTDWMSMNRKLVLPSQPGLLTNIAQVIHVSRDLSP